MKTIKGSNGVAVVSLAESPTTQPSAPLEGPPTLHPVVEPVEDALPGQETAAPVASEAPAGYHEYAPADALAAAEEPSLAPTEDKELSLAAARVLDEAEMENIFGRKAARRGAVNRHTVAVRVNINWGEVLGNAIGGAVGGAIGGAVAGPKGAALGAVGGFVGGAVASLVTQTLNHYWR